MPNYNPKAATFPSAMLKISNKSTWDKLDDVEEQLLYLPPYMELTRTFLLLQAKELRCIIAMRDW